MPASGVLTRFWLAAGGGLEGRLAAPGAAPGGGGGGGGPPPPKPGIGGGGGGGGGGGPGISLRGYWECGGEGSQIYGDVGL